MWLPATIFSGFAPMFSANSMRKVWRTIRSRYLSPFLLPSLQRHRLLLVTRRPRLPLPEMGSSLQLVWWEPLRLSRLSHSWLSRPAATTEHAYGSLVCCCDFVSGIPWQSHGRLLILLFVSSGERSCHSPLCGTSQRTHGEC